MKGYISFYESFYGPKFARYFRRPSDFDNSKFRIQFTVTNPKQLYLHVHRNSGFHPCYVSTHNYRTVDNLKHKRSDVVIFDRFYFDFDVDHTESKSIKYKLKNLRSHGLSHAIDLQNKLKKRFQSLIINDKIAKPAIDEAKEFAQLFKNEFGKEPALFFSGSKGCHAYTFFESVNLINPNRTVAHFAKSIKQKFDLNTMDLAVNKDTVSRIARVPYSRHNYTDLTVVPFKITDSYNKIMMKSLNPVIEHFDIENHLTNLNEHLKKIDKILDWNYKVEVERKKRFISSPKNRYWKILDHRDFFKQILGEPAKEYEHYNMYNCPFPDHDDNHPSFQVHITGYKCHGCGKNGNYWEFIKDYNGWNDEQVKNYLRNHSKSKYK